VIDAETAGEPDPVALAQLTGAFAPTADQLEAGTITGEIVKRTENILTVDVGGGSLKTVEVQPNAVITIPDIPGENTVNQLKHHLEIQRMSKSKGNVVNPDDWVQNVGADTVRSYLMFGFDWAKGGPWDSKGIKGPRRWLDDVWDIVVAGAPDTQGDAAVERHIERVVHQTIQKVGRDLEAFSFNTAIAAQMVLKNEVQAAIRDGKLGADAWREAVRVMLLLMAPVAPHISEELWARMGFGYSIHQQSWPEYDAAKAAEDVTTLVVMKNGKPIDRVEVPVSITEDEAKTLALATDGAKRVLDGTQPKRVIYIAGRGANNVEPKVNIVV
jgi:leucyl-tRNA synthetase